MTTKLEIYWAAWCSQGSTPQEITFRSGKQNGVTAPHWVLGENTCVACSVGAHGKYIWPRAEICSSIHAILHSAAKRVARTLTTQLGQ